VKDLQLAGGDLLPAGRGFATVTGSAYIRQRVATALAEPYGSDPYNPTWGSTLDNMLGAPQAADTATLVSAETSRVIQVLSAAQQVQVAASQANSTKSALNAADVIASVDSVSAAVGTPPSGRPDTVQVSVALTTLAGEQLQISRTVTNA
jgi:phage baseplate assembly protein W